MNFKTAVIAASCALSLNVVAGTMGAVSESRPWSIIGSLGYTWFDGSYHGYSDSETYASAIGDGQTALGRLAIARELGALKNIHFGAELGVQNGNTFRLGLPIETVRDELGGFPMNATIKPMLDLLATASYQPMDSSPVFGLIKLGVAYRRLTINNLYNYNDVSEAAFEVQAGLGMPISDRATLSLNYQGIFSGGADYTYNTVTGFGHISNVPNQNGLLLSLAYSV